MNIYIRKEIYPNEYRTPIIPKDVTYLMKYNYTIYVQSSNSRCFSDDDYRKAGAIVVTDEWYNYDAIIIGLKELQHIEYLNRHVHIYFAHCYKEQDNATTILNYFKDSRSILYDLEYFTYKNNQRFLAFGFYAGIAGCILALKQYQYKKLSSLSYITDLNYTIRELNKCRMNPTIAVVGYNGRCGQGVCHVLDKLNLNYNIYSRSNNKNNLEKYDIVFNCICLNTYIKPWFTTETIFNNPIVICDISCDPYHEYNPIQIYNKPTTWENPVFKYNDNVSIIAIDNLPSLIPIESSTYFSNKVVDLLLIKKNDVQKIWKRNLFYYYSKIQPLND